MNYKMGWLEYKKLKLSNIFFNKVLINNQIVKNSIVESIIEELTLFSKFALDKEFDIIFIDEKELTNYGSESLYINLDSAIDIENEGYEINCNTFTRLTSKDYKGLLTGTFRVIQLFILNKLNYGFVEKKNPSNPLRLINHWDNMDGSIERGYSGNSFFFEDEKLIVNKRTKDYARLIASVGINGVTINNVNVKGEATNLITSKWYKELAQLSKVFEDYGIKLFLSINFAAPMELGELTTADPLEDTVIAWWKKTSRELFENVPNLGGYLVKADSEGRAGPFTYNRDHADGANMLSESIQEFGGLIIWRCFVYNCTQDWRDLKTDRAKAGYDNFAYLDGKFNDNVILQIKNGPMDFQIRESVSPLIGAMKNTNQILEFQIAQEYTGQQIDVCYLIPMFKEILEFKTYLQNENDKISDIVSGKTYNKKNVGLATVTNTGNSYNWTGNDLAAANLFGFGLLSFDVSLTSEEIARQWIGLTFSTDKKIVDCLLNILLTSRETYEKYTTPLGIGWMVTPHYHYGVSIDGYEYDRWGTYHRADLYGIGVDRTKSGTGFVCQYAKENMELYNNIDTCPEELLLFFHHVRYDYVLKNGKTLIQHLYDCHFEGVNQVYDYIKNWNTLKNCIDEDCYNLVLQRFNLQLKNSIEWRDVFNSYFYRKSGINDIENRKIY